MGRHRDPSEGEWTDDQLSELYEEAVSDSDPEEEDDQP